jgi:hypothetical protein
MTLVLGTPYYGIRHIASLAVPMGDILYISIADSQLNSPGQIAREEQADWI